jgi:hypothetical protein
MVTRLVTGQSPDPAVRVEADDMAQWVMEFQTAERFTEKWHTQGNRCIDSFLGDSKDEFRKARLNLFYTNIVTLKAMLFAKLPKVEADRRFLDPNDDVARVASEMITRLLTHDMASPEDTFDSAIKEALSDRLIPGGGDVRLQYEMTEEGEQKTDECCKFVYTNWEDVLWSPCRTASELRWKAYRAYMDKDEVRKRFGDEVADLIPYDGKGPNMRDGTTARAVESSERKQAEVWEIFDKNKKEVLWMVKGYQKFLDRKPDPLGLAEFFPDEWMLANLTTRKLLPRPDYAMAQDLYEEIDELQTRISMLTEAAKVVGVYDQSAKEVERVFVEGVENQLIPVNNWALFADKGGLKNVIEWIPLDTIVNAIEVLQNQLIARINLLNQVTGMSDIMRGQATQANITATEQRIKAQFGSSRIQALQDEFAEFVQRLLTKKAQIIQRFYDPMRIIELSNILQTPDAQLAEQAVALIKNTEQFKIRITIRAESMAQVDMDQLKVERSEYLQAVSQFIGQSVPFMEHTPESAPFLFQLLKFGLSAFRAANEIEGVIDQFAAKIEQKIQMAASQPPPPTPEQQKIQGQMQIEQMKVQADQQGQQAQAALDGQKMQAEMAMEQQRFQMEMQKGQQEMEFAREEHQLKMLELQAKIEMQRQTSELKIQAAQQDAEIKADSAEHDAAIKQDTAEHSAKLAEQAASDADV